MQDKELFFSLLYQELKQLTQALNKVLVLAVKEKEETEISDLQENAISVPLLVNLLGCRTAVVDKHMGLAEQYRGKYLKDPKDMRNCLSVLTFNDPKQALLNTGAKTSFIK